MSPVKHQLTSSVLGHDASRRRNARTWGFEMVPGISATPTNRCARSNAVRESGETTDYFFPDFGAACGGRAGAWEVVSGAVVPGDTEGPV